VSGTNPPGGGGEGVMTGRVSGELGVPAGTKIRTIVLPVPPVPKLEPPSGTIPLLCPLPAQPLANAAAASTAAARENHNGRRWSAMDLSQDALDVTAHVG